MEPFKAPKGLQRPCAAFRNCQGPLNALWGLQRLLDDWPQLLPRRPSPWEDDWTCVQLWRPPAPFPHWTTVSGLWPFSGMAGVGGGLLGGGPLRNMWENRSRAPKITRTSFGARLCRKPQISKRTFDTLTCNLSPHCFWNKVAAQLLCLPIDSATHANSIRRFYEYTTIRRI